MTLYRSLTLIEGVEGKTHTTYNLNEHDRIKRVAGGFDLSFASSPSTSTFYPYHRVWEYQEIDTALTIHNKNKNKNKNKNTNTES